MSPVRFSSAPRSKQIPVSKSVLAHNMQFIETQHPPLSGQILFSAMDGFMCGFPPFVVDLPSRFLFVFQSSYQRYVVTRVWCVSLFFVGHHPPGPGGSFLSARVEGILTPARGPAQGLQGGFDFGPVRPGFLNDVLDEFIRDFYGQPVACRFVHRFVHRFVRQG